jgi:hypothetical protein
VCKNLASKIQDKFRIQFSPFSLINGEIKRPAGGSVSHSGSRFRDHKFKEKGYF